MGSIIEWMQGIARKAMHCSSVQGTIEQRVNSSLAEGIENACAEDFAADLEPVSIRDIKTEEDIALIAGEIAKQESKSMNWTDFSGNVLQRQAYCRTALDRLANESLVKAVAESSSFKGLMDGKYFLFAILQDLFELEHEWTGKQFKDNNFIFPLLFLSQIEYKCNIPLTEEESLRLSRNFDENSFQLDFDLDEGVGDG